jgi:uncharacterized protein (DUF1501 family)
VYVRHCPLCTQVIASRGLLQEERQVFFLQMTGFDTHSSALEQVQARMEYINAGLTAFVDEMKLRSVWDQVTLVSASDFGRTLDSNGAGTDHAWGGVRPRANTRAPSPHRHCANACGLSRRMLCDVLS